jgi:hypothetical protein
MNALAFDTHEYVKRLKAVGFTETQAEVQTTMMIDLLTTQMVTRDYFDQSSKDARNEMDLRFKEIDVRFKDLRNEMDLRFKDLRNEMDLRFKDLRNEMDLRFKETDVRLDARFSQIDARFSQIDARFNELELRLTIKLGAMMVLAIGVVATLIKIF